MRDGGRLVVAAAAAFGFVSLGISSTDIRAQQLSWVERSHGYLTSQAIATNGDGSAIVAGTFAGSVVFGAGEPNETTLTASTSATGAQRWAEVYLAKYAANGSLEWARTIRADGSDPSFSPPERDPDLFPGDALGNPMVDVRAVATAPDGSFAICGGLYPPATFGEGEPNETTLSGAWFGYTPPGGVVGYPGFYVAKYDSSGRLLWAREDGSDVARVVALGVGPDGDVYVTGQGSDPTILGIGTPAETDLGRVSAFVARYGSDGTLEWARGVPQTGDSLGVKFVRLLVQFDQSLVLVGTVAGVVGHEAILGLGESNETTLTMSGFFDVGSLCVIARYDGDGSLLWVRPGVGEQVTACEGVGYSFGILGTDAPDGSIFAGIVFGDLRLTLGAGESGETTFEAGCNQLILARYELNGDLRWARLMPAGDAEQLLTQPSGSFFLVRGSETKKYFDDGSPAEGSWIKERFVSTGEVRPLSLVSAAGFEDGSFIGTTIPRDVVVGPGEPNETTISDPFAPGLVILRYRGESTSLAAQTEPNGTNPVTVAPTNAAEDGSSDVAITFEGGIASSGTTTVVVTKGPPDPPTPANFNLGGSPQWYEISTTAGYVASFPDDPIIVCIEYDESGIADESALQMLHYENGAWVPLVLASAADYEQFGMSANPDTLLNKICALTYSLSPFAVGAFTGPVANAGPDQRIHAGQIVQLDGSASFADDVSAELLGFAWTITSRPFGSTTQLLGADTMRPSFVADLPGDFEISLVVTDLDVASAPDVVRVSSENQPPTADAGQDIGAVVGRNVELNGSDSSDPDPDPITYEWTIESRPSGSSAALSGGSDPARPTFVPDAAGLYVIQLVVSDGFASSAPDAVTVSAITPTQYAETLILDAMEVAAGLPPTAVTNTGNQRAFVSLLNQAVQALQVGRGAHARQKLEEALARTDGWALRGRTDPNGPGRDWITAQSASLALYALLVEALNSVVP